MVFNYWFIGVIGIVRSGGLIGMVGVMIGPLIFNVIVDNWSIRFYFLLIIVSSCVLSWSYYYIDGEENYSRFILIVMSFVASIVVLIFLGSLVGALIGWDGLGLTSFLLVIYYKNRKSLGSGIITALTNRIGDCLFLVILGLFLLGNDEYFYSKVLLLLITSITKRAQIPFSSWLPSAIAAPTPVRALVHSSTLVTAGVYLLLRFNRFTFEWLGLIGRITILIAGVCACVELDIKKIVALSTLSQLGVIIVALSVFQKNICFFHLVTHAMFKALLFMCVGITIHTIYGSQDFRSFRNIGKNVLYPISILIIANMALLGFPFMSGFYRKDIIIESFYSSYSCTFSGLFFLIGVGLTTAYRVKITNLAAVGNKTGLPTRIVYGGLSWQVKIPLTVLGLCSIFSGFIIGGFIRERVVLIINDKLIPLSFVAFGFIAGIMLTNFKNKNFSSMLILTPVFQKRRFFSVDREEVKKGDSGFSEEFGGPGILETIKNFYFTFHPLLAFSLLVMFLMSF